MKNISLTISLLIVVQTAILSQTCLPDGITFTTQLEIDNFKNNYPNCTHILGTLRINNSNIRNVDSLYVLTNIGGYLYVDKNPFLTNLEGLSNVEDISSLVIMDNDSLTNLNGLEKIDSIYYASIISNNSLLSLSGLNTLSYCGQFGVSRNPRLKNLNGLENLETSDVEGISIAFSDSLTSLTGLENVNYSVGISIRNNNMLDDISSLNNVISDSVKWLTVKNNPFLSICNENFICEILSNLDDNITIENNSVGCSSQEEVEEACINLPFSCLPEGITFSSQTEIDDFQVNYPNCTRIAGDVTISGDSITNLYGLSTLTEVEGYLAIGYEMNENNNLMNFLGLNYLTTVNGGLIIQENKNITNLYGLNNLKYIDVGIWITYNSNLTSLSGLDSISIIKGDIQIHNNQALTTIDGLANVESGNTELVLIENNYSLSSCETNFICNFISDSTSSVNINNNAEGCNNENEVNIACESIGISDNSINTMFDFYPNPARNIITISSSLQESQYELTIYNNVGQKVLHQYITNNKQNISKLIQGIYVIELLSENKIIRKKLIIK